jgi:hypothetical protein
VTWPRILAGTALAAIMLTVGLLIGAAESLSALGLGALVVGMVLIAEGYFLIWKVQLIHGLAEQTLGSAARLLALVPGKTAPRTDGGKLKPHTWWGGLTPNPAPTEEEAADAEDEPAVEWRTNTVAHRITDPELHAAEVAMYREIGTPASFVDADPSTAPIRMPAPDTQPDLKAAATVGPLPVTYEDWRRDWDARIAKDIAEIRGAGA